MKSNPFQASKIRTTGFTLIEVIIATMILVLLAGMVIPRLGGISRRTEQLSVDRVADLLAAFSYRDSLASGTSAIEFNANQGTLMLLTLKKDPEYPSRPATWMVDTLAQAVDIPDSISVSAYEDGALLPNGDWTLLTNYDGTRPKIELELEGENVFATIMLDPWAQVPTIIDELKNESAVLSDAIDLDAIGQDKDPW